MKKRIIVSSILILTLLLALAACEIGPTRKQTKDPKDPLASEEPTEAADGDKGGDKGGDNAEDDVPAIMSVYLDFSNGNPSGSIRSQSDLYYFDKPEEDWIIEMLSDVSGLDFSAEIIRGDDGGIIVDWSESSSLIAGIGGREQKRGFVFDDDDAMRWFMMDSMWRTVAKRYSAEDVFYTMGGGKELAFASLSPVDVFPSHIPYMGSPFYFGHDGEAGDDGLSFSYFDGWEFIFESGVGAWHTTVVIESDGSFYGYFTDTDMGDDGEDYPYGTQYVCNFAGKFAPPVKIDELEYSMKCISLTQEGVVDEERIIDGVRVITSVPYGFDDADEFRLYLPGKKVSELPEQFTDWVHYSLTGDKITFIGLYNVAGEFGFSSSYYEIGNTAPKKS